MDSRTAFLQTTHRRAITRRMEPKGIARIEQYLQDVSFALQVTQLAPPGRVSITVMDAERLRVIREVSPDLMLRVLAGS